MAPSRRARRLRWLAPVAVAAVIGLAAFVPTLSSAATPDLPTLTPQQLLAKVQQSNVQAFSGTFQLTTDLGIPNVADEAGYELVLAPHSPDSTIDHVGIAVDAKNGMPLQVTVVPKGQTKSALELGFTKISYERPSGPFSFTPPPGSAVTTKDLTKDQHDSGTQANAAPA